MGDLALIYYGKECSKTLFRVALLGCYIQKGKVRSSFALSRVGS